MNELKGEKGDPADVLGLRVSTEPPGCWPCRRGTQPEGLPEDPSPSGKGHMSPSLRGWLPLWGSAWSPPWWGL